MTVAPQRNNFKHIPPGKGGGRTFIGIKCATCPEGDSVSISGGMTSISQDSAEKAFVNRGWVLGKDRDHDKCPFCCKTSSRRAALAALAKATKPTNVLPIKKEEPPMPKLVAEAPLEMSRDDRRIIFAKLQDTYLDENVGYDKGWSDKRISEDLGVPRAWVEKIREENFGPDKSNSEAKELVKEGRDLVARLQKIAEEWVLDEDRKRQDFLARLIKFSEERERLEARLDRLEKLMG